VIAALLFMVLGLGTVHAESPAVPDIDAVGATLAEPPLDDPPSTSVADGRIERLTHALRCPVCQGLSVSDSPSDAARAMGDRIAELVRLGYTEDQITEYFVDRYGPWVELEPPVEGRHILLFLAPGVLLLLGLIVVGVTWRRQRPEAAAVEGFTPDPALADYRSRILAELDGQAP
jgi:cytochrome c-type biogenesis protein CcmH